MSTVRKLSYRSELCELERICCEVGAYCREHGIDPDTALALTLCLDELFTNTLKYGYRLSDGTCEGGAGEQGGSVCENVGSAGEQGGGVDERGGERGHSGCIGSTGAGREAISELLVEVHLERHEDRVEVHYYDRGQPFDPFSNLPPLPDVSATAPEALPTGGFGIHLLRKLSSQARYARQGNLNTISLTFNWR